MEQQRSYSVAIVGATGLVGSTMLQVLEERNFPIASISLYASHRSAGKTLFFRQQPVTVEDLSSGSFLDRHFDFVFFSAGKAISLQYAPVFADRGAIVIDNSSAWRLQPSIPLIVPEVNPHHLPDRPTIIANPNCSTIQLLTAITPIDREIGIEEIVVTTYQSPSGAGYSGVQQLEAELYGTTPPDKQPFPHQIAYNTVFHTIDPETGITEEERKMIYETQKILDKPSLFLRVTCVRVPIKGGHGEAVHITTERDTSIAEIRSLLSKAPGIILLDDPKTHTYPTPLLAAGKDEVFVGRLRQEHSNPRRYALWIVADNIRKGAATNAVQIAELIINRWNKSMQE